MALKEYRGPSNLDLNSISDFAAFHSATDLQEFSTSGGTFTRTGVRRGGRVWKKLDRAFFNMSWLQYFNVVYVDDIVITGDDAEGIKALKKFLQSQFHTKDLGPLRYFLGIVIARSKGGISLSQRKYTLDILSEAGMLGSKPCDTPMDPNLKLLPEEGELYHDPGRYRRMVGKLNYLTVTRFDISFAVSVVSQFLSTPRVPHWDAVIRILRYLKTAPGKGILYQNHGHNEMVGYCDADWAGSPVDRRSTSGYCVFLGGNLISWKSKKQTVVARSSAEAEYRAMALVTCELIWFKHILTELGERVLVPFFWIIASVN